MNLIDRYVYAVGRSLPQKQRTDIELELRSLIEDMLQRRTGGKPVEEADIEAVLLELGHPHKLAANYRGTTRHLIGPPLFEMYWLILRIVLGAVSLGIIISFVVSTSMNPPDTVWQLAGDFLGTVYSALIGAFGITTLVFALIEFFSQQSPGQAAFEQEKWQPKDLPQVPVSSLRIPRSEPIVAMIFILFFLLIINIDINLIGFYIGKAGDMQITPLFSGLFRSFLPWINLSIGISLVVESIKLISGRWNTWLILGAAVQKILGLFIGVRLFADSSIFNSDFFTSLNVVFAPAGRPLPANLPDSICRILTIVIIFGFVIDMLTMAWKSVRLVIDRRR